MERKHNIRLNTCESALWMILVSRGCLSAHGQSGSECHCVHPNPPEIVSSAHDAAHTEVTLSRALCWCIFSTWWQYRAVYNDQSPELKITLPSLQSAAHFVKWLGNMLSLIYNPNKLCRCTYMVGVFAGLWTRDSSVSWAEANNVTVVLNSLCVQNCGTIAHYYSVAFLTSVHVLIKDKILQTKTMSACTSQCWDFDLFSSITHLLSFYWEEN